MLALSYVTECELNVNIEISKNLMFFRELFLLKVVPIDLSKLSNVIGIDVIKKTVYDKLVTDVNVIDISKFVLKTEYGTNK